MTMYITTTTLQTIESIQNLRFFQIPLAYFAHYMHRSPRDDTNYVQPLPRRVTFRRRKHAFRLLWISHAGFATQRLVLPRTMAAIDTKVLHHHIVSPDHSTIISPHRIQLTAPVI